MGNIVHCCRVLSGYFRPQDALTQNEQERSALLSSEDSDCDPASLSDNSEEDLSTVSTGVTNLTLEPENFLFPDIILSSSLGEDVALVEPMVCLLVSEEGEATRLVDGDGKSRVFSEVETQTEAETWIGSQAQTQTEMLDGRAANEDLRLRDAETRGGETDAAAWLGEVNRINRQGNDANLKDALTHKVHMLTATSTDRISQTEQHTELHSGGEEQHTLPSRINGCSNESQHPSVTLTEHAKNIDRFTCGDETGQSGRGGKQAGQESDQNNTSTKPSAEEDAGQTEGQSALLANFSQHQKNWQQSVDGEETPHQRVDMVEGERAEEALHSADGPVLADRGDCVKGEVFPFAVEVAWIINSNCCVSTCR